MRRWILASAAMVAFACAPGKGSRTAQAARVAVKPGNAHNVVLITIDALRADRLGCYGYRRDISPAIDALARRGTLFSHAYTYWPKTRASMVMMLTGRRPSQNGYSHRNPMLLDFNPTLASQLRSADYRTAAIVDNANLAKALGYAKGFDRYREIWEEFKDEWAATRAITDGAVRFLSQIDRERPFFLWLHYINPHAPYAPPAPFDRRFVVAGTEPGADLPIVPDYNGGIPRKLYVPGQRKLGYYVAQYDGEVLAVDGEVGRVLTTLKQTGAEDRTVIVLTSDHGESLGEHDYYFDHGQDLFDPCLRVPLVVVVPNGRAGTRSSVLASTLDVVPTILDAVKVPYPTDLAGESLLPVVVGGAGPRRDRLIAQNDRNLAASFDSRFKLVARFDETGARYSLFDREKDAAEVRDLAAARPEELKVRRQEMERSLETMERERERTQKLIAAAPPAVTMSAEACERLRALGYVDPCRR